MDYDGASGVPDDVISDAEVLLDVIKKQLELDPESLPMGQAIVDDMSVAVDNASKEWSEADDIKNEYRTLLEQNRDNGQALSATGPTW